MESKTSRESMQKQVEAEPANEFINLMTSGGRASLLADHDSLQKKERHICSFMKNANKNRFTNIVLFNEGAVRLERENKEETNYIHATRVKSKFYGNYILAQAPMPETMLEWYRMIWQYHVQVIVCLVPLKNEDECSTYFNKTIGKKFKFKRFSLKTFTIHPDGPVDVYELRMTNHDVKAEEKERVVYVVHYPKWKIERQPDPRELLKVVRSTWALENSPQMSSKKQDATVLVHGTSGVRRTGCFVVLSMLCKQIRDNSTVSLVAACSTVRRYRYGVMRNKSIYCTMLEAVLNFAADQGLINRGNPSFVTSIKKIRSALLDAMPDKKDDQSSQNEASDEEDGRKGTPRRTSSAKKNGKIVKDLN